MTHFIKVGTVTAHISSLISMTKNGKLITFVFQNETTAIATFNNEEDAKNAYETASKQLTSH